MVDKMYKECIRYGNSIINPTQTLLDSINKNPNVKEIIGFTSANSQYLNSPDVCVIYTLKEESGDKKG